jgi:TPP-dependent 2-oxoacid decarboxylase
MLLCFLLQGANPLIFLINNGGYTIEVEIHDGPYNVIHTWCDLMTHVMSMK